MFEICNQRGVFALISSINTLLFMTYLSSFLPFILTTVKNKLNFYSRLSNKVSSLVSSYVSLTFNFFVHYIFFKFLCLHEFTFCKMNRTVGHVCSFLMAGCQNVILVGDVLIQVHLEDTRSFSCGLPNFNVNIVP